MRPLPRRAWPQPLGLPARFLDECREHARLLLVGDLETLFQPSGIVADLAPDAVEDAVGEHEILLLDRAPEHLLALLQPHRPARERGWPAVEHGLARFQEAPLPQRRTALPGTPRRIVGGDGVRRDRDAELLEQAFRDLARRTERRELLDDELFLLRGQYRHGSPMVAVEVSRPLPRARNEHAHD